MYARVCVFALCFGFFFSSFFSLCCADFLWAISFVIKTTIVIQRIVVVVFAKRHLRFAAMAIYAVVVVVLLFWWSLKCHRLVYNGCVLELSRGGCFTLEWIWDYCENQGKHYISQFLLLCGGFSRFGMLNPLIYRDKLLIFNLRYSIYDIKPTIFISLISLSSVVTNNS